jgi:hypothetical protein
MGGIRMRLLVTPKLEDPAAGHNVQVELINTTQNAISLRLTRPWGDSKGGIEAELEAAVSIESYPPIQPWLGQVAMRGKGEASPECSLKPGQTLSLSWRTPARRLKNQVANPLEIQNPDFTQDGLYSVHATLAVTVAGQPLLLRSNEQLVAIGGSRELPKHTYGRLWWAVEESKKAELSLGSQHKIAVGDRFLIHTGTIGWTWTLTITSVKDDRSEGTLVPSQETPKLPFPVWGAYAALIEK